MRLAPVIVLSFFLVCCGNNDGDMDDDSIIYTDTVLVWETNPDSMSMTRYMMIPDSAITVPRVINGLNGKYPEVRLVLIKQSGDTVYALIPDSDYLGNQMGSAGASAWFADAAINLTSVPGVNYVSFTMDTLSHAGSTIIGRDRFNNWKRQ
jgi:hypothetical protein